jgi:hypothetical protein
MISDRNAAPPEPGTIAAEYGPGFCGNPAAALPTDAVAPVPANDHPASVPVPKVPFNTMFARLVVLTAICPAMLLVKDGSSGTMLMLMVPEIDDAAIDPMLDALIDPEIADAANTGKFPALILPLIALANTPPM